MDIPFTPDDLDAVLFDMDGTLIETDDAKVARLARRIARVAQPERAERLARRLVMAVESPGNALFTLLDLVGLDTPVVRLIIALTGGGGDMPAQVPPIAGVDETVRHLAERYRLGVVSTRTVKESEFYLEALKIRNCFEVIAGRDTTWRIKPHPQPVKWAAEQLGVDPMRCLMVGDTTVDMRAGVRAGAWTCGVLCGFGQCGELERAGADFILAHTALLDEWVRRELRGEGR